MPAWLEPSTSVDPKELDHDELLGVWTANRNNLEAVMAADELMRRLACGKVRVIETIELTDEVTS
jgi:hypothetical protein